MNCPYCKSEMKKGILVGYRYLHFIPDEFKNIPLLSPEKIKIKNLLDDEELLSYSCKQCGIVLIDI